MWMVWHQMVFRNSEAEHAFLTGTSLVVYTNSPKSLCKFGRNWGVFKDLQEFKIQSIILSFCPKAALMKQQLCFLSGTSNTTPKIGLLSLHFDLIRMLLLSTALPSMFSHIPILLLQSPLKLPMWLMSFLYRHCGCGKVQLYKFMFGYAHKGIQNILLKYYLVLCCFYVISVLFNLCLVSYVPLGPDVIPKLRHQV